MGFGVKMEVKMEVKNGVKKDNSFVGGLSAARLTSTFTPDLTPDLTPTLTSQAGNGRNTPCYGYFRGGKRAQHPLLRLLPTRETGATPPATLTLRETRGRPTASKL